MRSFCALNTSPEILFLDHITPLASLLKMPLIITDEKNVELTQKYYPEVEIRHMEVIEFHLSELADEFDVLFECSYFAPHLKNLFRSLYKKEMRLVLCPHGQSDKKALNPYLQQDAILLYGTLMREMLHELKLWNHGASHAIIGNFRWNYYQKNRRRMDLLTDSEIFALLKPTNKTLLYAPTWKDDDEATSFFKYVEKIFFELPSSWNLIIKIHPLLPVRDPAAFYKLSILEEKKENVIIVHDFPYIYPVLQRIDAYLGDYSSVGYDFLIFQKPMFFLTKPHLSAPLHTCGRVLDPSQNIFRSIEKGLDNAFHSIQKNLYQKAFAEIDNIEDALNHL